MSEHDKPALEINETVFLGQVIQLAHVYQWRVAHFRPAMTGKGWRTPVQADGAGFPDLVLVRPPRLVFAELKSEKGKVSDAQQLWIDALSRCYFKGVDSPVEVYVWKPSSWEKIVKVLSTEVLDA